MLNLYLTNHLNFVQGKKRASKISVMEMLEAKYERKAELKEKELELKKDGAGDCSAKTSTGRRRKKAAPTNGDGGKENFFELLKKHINNN